MPSDRLMAVGESPTHGRDRQHPLQTGYWEAQHDGPLRVDICQSSSEAGATATSLKPPERGRAMFPLAGNKQ